MKKKHLFVVMAAMLGVAGLWFARSVWRPQASPESTLDVGVRTKDGVGSGPDAGGETPPGPTRPGRMLRPTDPARRFMDFTPEERVDFARKGHGPGG